LIIKFFYVNKYMDDKILLGWFFLAALIIYPVYLAKKNKNLTSLIASYGLLAIVFIICEVKNAWIYTFWTIVVLILALFWLIWYPKIFKKRQK